MGNFLCKDSPRRVYVKSPVTDNRNNTNSIYGQQQIHPNSLTNVDGVSPKRFSAKSNFFHSTPNLTENGKMLSTVSLDARIFDNGSYRTPPIAPPRKKRSTLKKGSTLPSSFSDDGAVRNGFKDVFINGAPSRVLTFDDIEYMDKDENVMQTRAAIEHEEEKNRKLKVGNKKTDKFFGESLSDHLSDEPVTPVEEPIEQAEISKTNEVDRSSTSEMKLFFLMNMLEQEREENENYLGQIPIEEPLFVARKKEIKKHICDDEDHMHHHHFHKHESDDQCDHTVAPPKPDRDFSRYQTSTKEEEEANEVQATQAQPTPIAQVDPQPKPRVMKSISRESLPSPPAAPTTPKRKSGYASLPGTPTITIESIDFPVLKEDVDVARVEQYAKVEADAARMGNRPPALDLSKEPIEELDGSLHNQSPTTPVIVTNGGIMDQMIQKAYGFHGYHPEDTEHNHDDGSYLVTPTSKLTTRKTSVGRKVSAESLHSTYSTDSETVSRINELLTPSFPRKKISYADDPLSKISESHSVTEDTEESKNNPSSSAKDRRYEKVLKASSINDIIEGIYSKNSEIMNEFQSYLEKTVETHPVINVDQEKAFLISKALSDHEFIRTPEPPALYEDEIDDNQSYSDSFESTDTEQETVRELDKIKSKLPKFNTKRRESIEDVDGWFNNHLDLEQKQSELCGSFDPQPNNSSGYDLQAVFPFGKTIFGRRESLSDEFFAEAPASLLKPHQTVTDMSTLRESESSEDGEARSKPREERSNTSPDHSSLLKYFDKGSKETL